MNGARSVQKLKPSKIRMQEQLPLSLLAVWIKRSFLAMVRRIFPRLQLIFYFSFSLGFDYSSVISDPAWFAGAFTLKVFFGFSFAQDSQRRSTRSSYTYSPSRVTVFLSSRVPMLMDLALQSRPSLPSMVTALPLAPWSPLPATIAS